MGVGIAAVLIAIILLVIFLIVLGSMVGFIVDWLWFSATGFLNVFWTVIIAKATLFVAVFVATASILWLNGALAYRFARSPWRAQLPDLVWRNAGVLTLPDVLALLRDRLPWPIVIAAGALILAVLVGWGEIHNWDLFLRFLRQVPFGVDELGQPAAAHLQASCRGACDAVRNVFRARGDSTCAFPARIRQAQRAADGSSLHRAQHRRDAARL